MAFLIVIPEIIDVNGTTNLDLKNLVNDAKETAFFGKQVSLFNNKLIISNSEVHGFWYPTGHPLVNYKNLTIEFQIEDLVNNQNISLRGNGLVPRYYGGSFDINTSSPTLITIPYAFTWQYSTAYKEVEIIYNKTKEEINNETKEVTLVTDELIKVTEKEYSDYKPIDVSKSAVLNDFKGGYLDPDVSACGDLTIANSTYDLTQNVNTTNTCFNFEANNVTLDCHGFMINASQTGAGDGINVTNYNNSIIKNCIIVQGSYGSSGYRYPAYFYRTWNSVLDNNTILSRGMAAIRTESSVTNLTISNNLINTTYYGYWSMGYSNDDNSIRNSTIKNNKFYGGGIGTRGHYYNITNNTIITTLNIGAEQRGIELFQSYYNTLTYNNITVISGRGIRITGTNIYDYNQSIDATNYVNGLPVNYTWNQQNLTFSGLNNQYGQIFIAYSGNITIKDSNISANGIYVANSTRINISNNNISTQYGYSIYMDSDSKNNSIQGNTISHIKTINAYPVAVQIDGPYGFVDNNNVQSFNCLAFYGQQGSSRNLIVTNNVFVSNNSDTSTFYVSRNSYVANNNFTSNTGTQTKAMTISTCDNCSFYYNILSANAANKATLLLDGSQANVTLSHLYSYANTSGSNALMIGNRNNFTLIDSILNASKTYDISIVTNAYTGIMNFTNVTRADGATPVNITWAANMNMTLYNNWWLEVNVSNGTNPLQANVSIYDSNSNFILNTTTNTNGYAKVALREYMNENNTLITYYSNYTINTTTTGYDIKTNTINMSANRAVNIIMTSSGVPDTTPPVIAIVYPANNTNIVEGNRSTWINITTDEISNCSWGYNDTGYINLTLFTNTNALKHSFNFTNGSNFTDGNTYTLYYRCQDASLNNNTQSAIHVFRVNESSPSIPTTIRCNGNSCNQTFTTSPITINCSGSVDYDDVITYVIEKGNQSAEDSYTNSTTLVTQDSDGGSDVLYFSGENCGSECAADAFDQNLGTKWLDFHSASWITIKLGWGGQRVWNYSLCSANDAPERDPDDWTLEGSNDNVTWTILDTVIDNGPWASRNTCYNFEPDLIGTYLYYKINITQNGAGGIIQLGEIYLYNQTIDSSLAYTYTTVGNHTNGSTYLWDISSDPNETYEMLRCWAIDLTGSNTYSDYYTESSNMTINYTVSDLCAYISGNYVLDCSNYCNITSNVIVDAGYNVTVKGTGEIRLFANITNWDWAFLHLGNCYVFNHGGSFI
jgi:parallel beta-helix repeat protein